MGEPIEVREWMTHQIQESWTMDENEANLGREKQTPTFPTELFAHFFGSIHSQTSSIISFSSTPKVIRHFTQVNSQRKMSIRKRNRW
jgi:hypothetical protein